MAPRSEHEKELAYQDPNKNDEETECRRRNEEAARITYPGGIENMPEDLKLILIEGNGVPGDSGIPQDLKPEWYDPELFQEGQRCSLRYSAGLAESQLLSLFLMFSVSHGVEPLIATGKSDTPFAAFQRYLSTAVKTIAWYTSDPFDPNSDCWKSLVSVRNMHKAVRKMCTTTPKEELAIKFTVGKESSEDRPESLWCPMTPFLVSEFNKRPPSCPGARLEVDSLTRPFLTQMEMSVTQFSFFGVFLSNPELFGAPYITDRELEGLVHLWAVIGYCLGVRDRFNWCKGGMEPTRKRSKNVLNVWLKHNFLHVAPTWEHMSRCAFEGIKMFTPSIGEVETHFVYLFEDVLQMPSDLPKVLTWSQWFHLWKFRILLQWLPRYVSFFIPWLGRSSRKRIQEAVNFSEEKLKQLRAKEFVYTSPCVANINKASG